MLHNNNERAPKMFSCSIFGGKEALVVKDRSPEGFLTLQAYGFKLYQSIIV